MLTFKERLQAILNPDAFFFSKEDFAGAGKKEIEQLASYLRVPNVLVRKKILTALRYTENPLAIDAIRPYLHDRDLWVRESAILALGRIKSPEVYPELMPLLKDPEPLIRENAVIALGNQGEVYLIDEIIPLLQDPEESVRSAALTALEHFKGPYMSTALMKLAKDDNREIQATALSLFLYTQSWCVPYIIRHFMRDENPLIRESAENALESPDGLHAFAETIRSFGLHEDASKVRAQELFKTLCKVSCGVIEEPPEVPRDHDKEAEPIRRRPEPTQVLIWALDDLNCRRPADIIETLVISGNQRAISRLMEEDRGHGLYEIEASSALTRLLSGYYSQKFECHPDILARIDAGKRFVCQNLQPTLGRRVATGISAGSPLAPSPLRPSISAPADVECPV